MFLFDTKTGQPRDRGSATQPLVRRYKTMNSFRAPPRFPGVENSVLQKLKILLCIVKGPTSEEEACRMDQGEPGQMSPGRDSWPALGPAVYFISQRTTATLQGGPTPSCTKWMKQMVLSWLGAQLQSHQHQCTITLAQREINTLPTSEKLFLKRSTHFHQYFPLATHPSCFVLVVKYRFQRRRVREEIEAVRGRAGCLKPS